MPILDRQVTDNVREVKFFKDVIDPKTRKKKSIKVQRTFLDITVSTMYATQHTHQETMTAHIYPGFKGNPPELRVSVGSQGIYDKRKSMTIKDFVPFARKRFGEYADNILNRIDMLFGEALQKATEKKLKKAA